MSSTVPLTISLVLVFPSLKHLVSLFFCRIPILILGMMELRSRVIEMSQIVMITREGKITCKPFEVNRVVASADAEQEINTNSPEANSDKQEETEVAEESAA